MIGLAGLLLTSATGANAQWTPRARPSRAVTSPVKRASSSDRVAPTAIALGSGTTPRRMRKFMPRSMSAAISSGTSEACWSAVDQGGQRAHLGLEDDHAADLQPADLVEQLLEVVRAAVLVEAEGAHADHLRDLLRRG